MEFKDRSPEFPGRIRLTPVEGSSDLYDFEFADGRVAGGNYSAGTPLNAANLNGMLEELYAAIEKAKIGSIRISDGTNEGEKTAINGKDIVIKLPAKIKAVLDGTIDKASTADKATKADSATTANYATTAGTADTAKALSGTYGSVTIKTVSLSTSATTVYSSKKYSSAIVIIAPWNGGAKNTAIFAISNAEKSTSINDLTYVNKQGYIKKDWNGYNFRVWLSDSNAKGDYSVTIIDAHY